MEVDKQVYDQNIQNQLFKAPGFIAQENFRYKDFTSIKEYSEQYEDLISKGYGVVLLEI
jgi:hypothetical protein